MEKIAVNKTQSLESARLAEDLQNMPYNGLDRYNSAYKARTVRPLDPNEIPMSRYLSEKIKSGSTEIYPQDIDALISDYTKKIPLNDPEYSSLKKLSKEELELTAWELISSVLPGKFLEEYRRQSLKKDTVKQ